jgi:hypothetical protein
MEDMFWFGAELQWNAYAENNNRRTLEKLR